MLDGGGATALTGSIRSRSNFGGGDTNRHVRGRLDRQYIAFFSFFPFLRINLAGWETLANFEKESRRGQRYGKTQNIIKFMSQFHIYGTFLTNKHNFTNIILNFLHYSYSSMKSPLPQLSKAPYWVYIYIAVKLT